MTKLLHKDLNSQIYTTVLHRNGYQ